MKNRVYKLMNNTDELLTLGFSHNNPYKITILVAGFWGEFKVVREDSLGDLTDFAGSLRTGVYADIEMELSTSETEIYFLSIIPGKVSVMTSERTIIWSSQYSSVEDVTGKVFIP